MQHFVMDSFVAYKLTCQISALSPEESLQATLQVSCSQFANNSLHYFCKLHIDKFTKLWYILGENKGVYNVRSRK